MKYIDTNLVESSSLVFSVTIILSPRGSAEREHERDIDESFTDCGQEAEYYRGSYVKKVLCMMREESFEADPGFDSSVSTETLFMRVPSHRFKLKTRDGDYVIISGVSYNAIISRKRMGGFTDILLQAR